MRRGADGAIAVSIGLARAHAARRIQWAFRLLQMRRLLLQHAAWQAQLKAWREARKSQRKAARAQARAGGNDTGRIDAQQETTGHAAAVVDEGSVASGQAGERADGVGHWWAVGALLVAAAALGLVAEPALAPVSAAAHHLPRPPGARFNGSGGSSGVDLRLRWLWLQACPTAGLAAVPGEARVGRSKGGRTGVGGSWGHPDWCAPAGQPARFASQPTALCEVLRLRDGAYGLPRPPERGLGDYGWRRERVVPADAGYGDKGGSVVARRTMDVLIAVELVELCQRVSRWPGHVALLRGWWKGHPDLTHPGVVLAAYALACVFRDQGYQRASSTTESLVDACRWRRGCCSRAPDVHMRAIQG